MLGREELEIYQSSLLSCDEEIWAWRGYGLGSWDGQGAEIQTQVAHCLVCAPWPTMVKEKCPGKGGIAHTTQPRWAGGLLGQSAARASEQGSAVFSPPSSL